MLHVRLASDYLFGKLLFSLLSLVISLIVYLLYCPVSHEMSWMRSGTELSQSLRVFLPTLIGRSIAMYNV